MKKYAIIMAAGKGTRMNSDKPKVIHEVLYKPMITLIIEELKKMAIDKIYVVVGHKAEDVKAICLQDGVEFVLQSEQLGTGHAVKQVGEYLKGKEGTTIVLNGDAPLITKETLEKLVDTHITNEYAGTIMTCDCPLENKFGRIIKENNQVKSIVEFKDLQDGQYEITEMNLGEYCFDNKALFEALELVKNDNAQSEYYLPDVFEIMANQGIKVGSHKIQDLHEVGGINDRVELAQATKALQRRVNKMHMLNGVEIIDPENTYITTDVVIGKETVIEPGSILKGNTVIGNNCHIGPHCELTNVTLKDNVEIKFSVLSDSIVETGADVGPYARLRTNCHILEKAHIGNFVEMKNTTFGVGSKSGHLTYLGDSTVGKGVNIGCGTITVNYDGKNKFRTTIGDHAFIGCNANLMAPVTVGYKGYVAAGSTITNDIEDEAMGIARARQENKEDYVKVLEEKRNNI